MRLIDEIRKRKQEAREKSNTLKNSSTTDQVRKIAKRINDTNKRQEKELMEDYNQELQSLAKKLYPKIERYFNSQLPYMEKCTSISQLSKLEYILYFDLTDTSMRVVFPDNSQDYEENLYRIIACAKLAYSKQNFPVSNEEKLKRRVISDINHAICSCNTDCCFYVGNVKLVKALGYDFYVFYKLKDYSFL